MNWEVLTQDLNTLIKRLFARGSIGVSEFVESVLPLRRRLEEGERTEELYNEIQGVIKHRSKE